MPAYFLLFFILTGDACTHLPGAKSKKIFSYLFVPSFLLSGLLLSALLPHAGRLPFSGSFPVA